MKLPTLSGLLSKPSISAILQHRPLQRYISALIAPVVAIIFYESILAIGLIEDIISATILAFCLVFAVVYASFRHGLWPGIISAVICNLFLIYAYVGPGRNIQTLDNMLQGQWLLTILFFLPAIIIGYLRDRIDYLFQQEKNARLRAERGERRLRALLEQMPLGVIIADAKTGTIDFSNRQLEEILGISIDGSDLYSHYLSYDLYDLQNQPLSHQDRPMKRILKDKQLIDNEEYKINIDKGEKILKFKGVPIYDISGNPESGLLVIDDITAERELDQRKDDFLSIISHELKTPITSLKIYTHLILKQKAKEGALVSTDSLTKIDEQATKLQRLIDSMLYMSQVQSGKLEYNFRLTDTSQFLNNVIREIRLAIATHTIMLDCQANVFTKIDQDAMGQVVTNLINNAAKYSPPQSTITICLIKDNDQAVLSIKDQGLGLSKIDAERIFDRFYQAPHTTNHRSGLGIGLYLSADIIKNHQGKIWVESNIGQGSTFFVSLPICQTTETHQTN